jgi:hypothetical protein
MTRLRILSDMHLDTPNLPNIAAINQGDENIVVCAGDVMNNPIGSIRSEEQVFGQADHLCARQPRVLSLPEYRRRGRRHGRGHGHK